jgi:hypothetical protein
MSAQSVPNGASDEQRPGPCDADAVHSYLRRRGASLSGPLVVGSDGREDHYKCSGPRAELTTVVGLGCSGSHVGSGSERGFERAGKQPHARYVGLEEER